METGIRRGNGDAGKQNGLARGGRRRRGPLKEKVAMKGSKSKNPEGKAKRQENNVKKLRALSENNSGGIRRNTGLCERGK